jgi:PAS domain S-box-containing protein
VAGFGARLLLTPVIGDTFPFIFAFFAVLLSTSVAGLGPGLWTILVSAILVDYRFFEPVNQLGLGSSRDQAALLVFTILALAIAVVVARIKQQSIRWAETVVQLQREREQRLAAEAAEHSLSMRHQAMIEHALDAAITMDTKGCVVSWNRSAELLFGYSSEEAVGARLSDLIIPDRLRAEHEQGLKRFLATGEGKLINNRVKLAALRRDGTEFPVELTVTNIPDDQGMLFSGFIRDITLQQGYADIQERFKTTLDSIGDAVIAIDTAERIAFINPEASHLTGWGIEEALGREASEIIVLVQGESGKRLDPPYKDVLAGGDVVQVGTGTLLVNKDGVRCPVEVSGSPIKDSEGKATGVVLVFHDISERRRIDDARNFLSQASKVLSESLDYEETLAKVAHLSTPKIADWCAVDIVVDGHEETKRLATAHVDPQKVRFVHEITERYPPEENPEQGVLHILRTGESEWMPVIPDELILAAAKDEEHLRLIRELGLRSYMGVPLKIQDRVLGVISFVSAESGRIFDERDLALAEELAARAAIAIENSRLYAKAQAEIVEREVRERQQSAVVELGKLALSSAELQPVIDAALRLVSETMGSHSASIWQYDQSGATFKLLGQVGWREDVGEIVVPAEPGGQLLHTLQVDEPVLYEDLAASHEFSPLQLLLDQGFKQGIGAAIVGHDRKWGVLLAHFGEESRFSKQDAAFVLAVSNILGTAIDRRASEEAVLKLAAIVESSDDAIISKNLDGILTNWNPGAQRMYGYTPEEAIGQSVNLIIPPSRRHELPIIMSKLRRGEHIDHFETVRLRKDGTEIDVSVSIAPIKNSTGAVIGASVIARDITERKITEEIQRQLLDTIEAERKRLNDLLASVPGVVWEAWGEPDAANQRIDFVSNYVEKMLGYSVQEWLSEPNFWLKIVHPEDKERAAAVANTHFTEKTPGLNQFRWIAKDGRVLWINSHSVTITDTDGTPLGMRGVSLDITSSKEAELALAHSEERYRALAGSLDRRVKERTAELTAANTELEAFSYSVSHDLRSPLRALDGFSRILLEDYGDKLDAEGKDYLTRIRAASQRMGQLIEDLLNLAYVTRTEMKRESVDLSALLHSIAEDLNSRQEGRRVHFEVEPGMIVDGDPRLLKAAMDNLMQNAWKFTQRKEKPCVHAGYTQDNGRRTYFIKDNGAGFEQEYAGKLFQPFQRLHSTTEYPGTGIGLATVQRIIQRHGGRIWAEGKVDEGATVYFTL